MLAELLALRLAASNPPVHVPAPPTTHVAQLPHTAQEAPSQHRDNEKKSIPVVEKTVGAVTFVVPADAQEIIDPAQGTADDKPYFAATWRGLELGVFSHPAKGQTLTEAFKRLNTSDDLFKLVSGPTPTELLGQPAQVVEWEFTTPDGKTRRIRDVQFIYRDTAYAVTYGYEQGAEHREIYEQFLEGVSLEEQSLQAPQGEISLR